MCGILSAFYPDSVSPPSVEDLKHGLEKSLDIIKHRGPDSNGIYMSPDNRCGLAHTRLSIIDLETGQQPLSDEDGSIYCVVAGEIYDHDRIRAEMQSQGYSFKTKSDSELVVQLYKRDGFNLVFSLRGEFTFILYDVKRRLQFIGRDRFGIKPLYYTVNNGCIMFGSEMKAFMGLGWNAEWDVDSVVNDGDSGDERTVFKGVFKLPAGYTAICRASGCIEKQPYWDISYPAASAVPSSTVDTMVSTARDLLVESVRLRLRSDVPLAVYLSGGIDSSAVAGIATHVLRQKNPNAKITAFTLAYIDDKTTDESPVAAETAAFLGADHILVEATEKNLVGVFEDVVYHSEMINTSFHGSGKLLLSRAVRAAGFKVVLSGEGSDEIFGGYQWFPLDYLRQADPAAASLGIALPSEAERRALSQEILAAKGLVLPDTSSLQKSNGPRSLLDISAHLTVAQLSTSARIPLTAAMFPPEVLQVVGNPSHKRCVEEGIDGRVRYNSITGYWHSLNVALYVMAKGHLGRRILNFIGDRADMANSLESRIAFLDHRFVDYVSSLPPSLKIMPIAGDEPGKWTLTEKWVLRQAVKPFVTEETYLRKKTPFNPPPSPAPAIATELVPLQIHLKARLTQATVERLGFIHWPFVREVLTDYLEAPTFPEKGIIDSRACVLLAILSYIVLQERFNVPTYKP
ncbi:putative asparagine synthase [Mycena pura]|uniref:Asparagine synthase n=1 Tax=Mycena pura TaxID=153505 RepID=A0AAD6VJR9_9AGAR|nr:putative asparagine synthase [Mycena pura]